MTIGQKIKTIRQELNISQTDLAKKVNISKQTLYKYENDIISNIPFEAIEKISNALNIKPAYLIGWDNESFQSNELYSLYEQASPEIQSAVELLLRSAQHSPESQPKN